MARSITFVVDGDVDTQVTITEQSDGTLLFELEVLGTGSLADLRALFFDVAPGFEGLIDGLMVSTGDDVTDFDSGDDSVTSLGGDANINGQVVNELGAFDVGVEFGAPGPVADDIQSTSFVLGHDSQNLSLDMLDRADFGVTTTSIGTKTGDQANGVADNDTLDVDENASNTINVLSNDTNGAGNTVTGVEGGFVQTVTVDGLELGQLIVNADGTATFDADGEDVDSLAAGEQKTYTVTYTSTAPDGSLATADVAAATENGAVVPIAVLANDDDVDSDDDSTTLKVIAASAASGATVTFSGAPGAGISYDPDSTPAFESLAEGETTTDTITYTIEDSHGATDTATVTVTVTGTNDAPVATPDGYTTDEDTVLNVAASGVLTNDTDVDASDVLTVGAINGVAADVGTTVTLGSGAEVTLNSDGSFDYDPNGQFDFLALGESATDSFIYTVDDGHSGADTATVTITVDGVNDDPVAVDDAYTTDEDTVLNVAAINGVLANDSDIDTSDVLTVTEINGVAANVGNPVTLASGALVTLNADGSFGYDPNGQFEGLNDGDTALDSFIYTVDDGNGGTDTATVEITITGTDDGTGPQAPGRILISGANMTSAVKTEMENRGFDVDIVSSSQLEFTDLSLYQGVWTSWSTTFSNSSGLLDDNLLEFVSNGGNLFVETYRSNIDELIGVDALIFDDLHTNQIGVIDGSYSTLTDGLTSAEMSGWGSSAHGRIVDLGSYTGVMTVDSTAATDWSTAAKEFGDGNIVITTMDVALHAQFGFGSPDDKYDFAENALLLA